MVRNFVLLIVAFNFIFLYSCQSERSSLNKTWFYSHNDFTDGISQKTQNLTPENFIDLRSDGSFTSYISEFEYGTWKKEKNIIHFQNQKGDKKSIGIMTLSDEELMINLSPGVQNNSRQVFNGISNKKNQQANNPFAKENNHWRIPSAKPETSEQIKARLVNHFRFWETYFQWAVTNNLQSLDIRSPNSPLKLYGNGFELIPYDELSETWKSNFFNEENCREAWDKLKTLIETKDISWSKTENRFKRFISAFQQLQGLVE